jgi:hypothetical protein
LMDEFGLDRENSRGWISGTKKPPLGGFLFALY